jgi:hypothetical protein
MKQLSASRLEVAKAIHSLTTETPLHKCAGELAPDGSDSTSSYAAVHVTLNKKCQLYLNKYPEHILHYAVEWERILTTRISDWLRQSEKLRVDLDHYQNKVEDLNQGVNRAQNKGKNVNDKEIEKLKRNEAKFVQARQDYDKFVNELCGYMEEVLDRGWKDLHPMLVKMAQFDTTFSNDEAAVLKSINGVTHELMSFGTKNDLMPQGRLKELETSSPDALIRKYHPSGTTLTIMGGEVGSGGLNSSGDELPLGGGGGLFGSIARKENSSENFGGSNGGSLHSSRNNSEVFAPRSRTNTGDSDWSRGHMPTEFAYVQNAAPAPTLEDVFGSPGGISSAPAGIPPPPPSMPPPLPPQQMPNMGGLSMYDNRRSVPSSMPPPMAPPPIPQASTYQIHSAPNSGGLFSPGSISQGSTNPFDNDGRSGTNPFG